MSLYADYIQERLGDHIVEIPEGFATYRFLSPFQCYIVDIYIKREFRNKGIAKTLADEIVKVAKFRGCKELVGSVAPSAKNATESLKALLTYDMKLDRCDSNLIIFKKEI